MASGAPPVTLWAQVLLSLFAAKRSQVYRIDIVHGALYAAPSPGRGIATIRAGPRSQNTLGLAALGSLCGYLIDQVGYHLVGVRELGLQRCVFCPHVHAIAVSMGIIRAFRFCCPLAWLFPPLWSKAGARFEPFAVHSEEIGYFLESLFRGRAQNYLGSVGRTRAYGRSDIGLPEPEMPEGETESHLSCKLF